MFIPDCVLCMTQMGRSSMGGVWMGSSARRCRSHSICARAARASRIWGTKYSATARTPTAADAPTRIRMLMMVDEGMMGKVRWWWLNGRAAVNHSGLHYGRPHTGSGRRVIGIERARAYLHRILKCSTCVDTQDSWRDVGGWCDSTNCCSHELCA